MRCVYLAFPLMLCAFVIIYMPVFLTDRLLKTSDVVCAEVFFLQFGNPSPVRFYRGVRSKLMIVVEAESIHCRRRRRLQQFNEHQAFNESKPGH